MGLIKVHDGIVEDAESKVKLHTDKFHIHSEEIELERYQQSDGTISNFMSKWEMASGTVTETVATHSLDISTGIGVVPIEASYESQSDFDILREDLRILNFRMLSHVSGTGNGKLTEIGYFSPGAPVIEFKCDNAGAWTAYVYDGATGYSKAVTIVDGDLLSIASNKYRQTFYVNGEKVFETDKANSGVNYHIFAGVSAASMTVARVLKISNLLMQYIAKPIKPKKLN